MTDLCIKPSGLPESQHKPWVLVLRDHGPAETSYTCLCRLTDELADEVIQAGAPFWLFGPPDTAERHRARELERARVLEEEAAEIRKKHAKK